LFLLGSSILLCTRFFQLASVCGLRIRDQVLHPYRTVAKITFPFNLIVQFKYSTQRSKKFDWNYRNHFLNVVCYWSIGRYNFYQWLTKRVVKVFSKLWKPPEISRGPKNDIKQVPYWGTTNIRRRCTKLRSLWWPNVRGFRTLLSNIQTLPHFQRICEQFLGPLAKLRKATIGSAMSVCPSTWNNSAPLGRILTRFDIWVFFENRSKKAIFLISSFRRVLYVVCFLLGNYPAYGFYMPTFRNTLSVPSS